MAITIAQRVCTKSPVACNGLKDMIMVTKFLMLFRSGLDGELKRLNGTGKYIHKKKASIITAEMEEVLWE